MKELRQNSEKILKKLKTTIKEIIHNKIFIIIFSVILFSITDLLLIYPYINNYIKNKIYQDVEQQGKSLNDEIDKLMEYGDITTGEFFDRYSPDLTKDVKKHNVLQQFIQELPEKYKMVFNLYVLEEMPHKDIAVRLGITEGTSKSNLARARDILKRKIKEYLKNEI